MTVRCSGVKIGELCVIVWGGGAVSWAGDVRSISDNAKIITPRSTVTRRQRFRPRLDRDKSPSSEHSLVAKAHTTCSLRLCKRGFRFLDSAKLQARPLAPLFLTSPQGGKRSHN